MLNNFQKAFIITKREIRDQFRDWRIIAPILILTVFFPGLMNFTAEQSVEFVARYGAEIIADRLIPFLLMVVGFFPIYRNNLGVRPRICQLREISPNGSKLPIFVGTE